MLTITLLGTAATMPLPDRALTAAVAECGGHSLLFDCGEGTQTAARRAGVNLMNPLPRRPHLRPAGAAADAGLSGPHPPAGAVRAEGARRSLGGTAGADGASAVPGLC